MSQLDILYRALIDYRKNTREDKDCVIQRSAIIAADNESDKIEVKRNKCKIETDWIDAIQRGLEFIEKAIKEERQFIRSNGEIIPIEKVKRVSKDSVEHLARHSNLLTREPAEGADLIPDNLYTVERLSDFAVYENRFLYMLLCYLRDFISLRYERIVELTNTYNGKMSMNKTVVESYRRVEYKVELTEEKKNDEYLKTHNEAQEEIARILTIYNAVVYFLNTPLMNEVSKSPMLKPPITRTNVLRMNKNFREVMALYEYISAYDRDGFSVVTEVKTLSPFSAILADEIVETVELSSFLTYEYGLGIKDYFKERYELEEQAKKDEERRKHAEKIKTIKRHLADGNISAEEYIIMLEKRISDLENVEDELDVVRAELNELRTENKKLTLSLKRANSKIAMLEEEIEIMKIKHAEEIAALHQDYTMRIDYLINDLSKELDDVYLEYEQKIEDLEGEYGAEIERLKGEYKAEIADIQSNYNKQIEYLHTEYERIIEEWHEEYAMRIDYLTEDLTREIEETTLLLENKAKEVDYEYRREIERINEENENAIRELNDNYAIELDRMRNGYENEIRVLIDNYEREIERINAEHERIIQEMTIAHEEAMQKLSDEFNAYIDNLNKQHEDEVNALNKAHEDEVNALNKQHEDEVNAINKAHEDEVDALNKAHEDEINKINSEHQALVDDMTAKHSEEVGNLNTTIQTLKEDSAHAIDLRDRIIDTERRKFEGEMEKAKAKISATEKEVYELTYKCDELADLKTLSDGRLNALRSEYGLIKENEDFTDKKMAEELEHQYDVFRKFRKFEWQKTKKRIRAEVFAEVRAKEAERLAKKAEKQKKRNKD